MLHTTALERYTKLKRVFARLMDIDPALKSVTYAAYATSFWPK